MTKTTIYITRHGQTQWNIEERMQGHHDSPLTEHGMQQARWLRDALTPIDFAAIYASPTAVFTKIEPFSTCSFEKSVLSLALF
mgnify:CR=1 FL=1